MKHLAQACDVGYVCSPRLASRLSTYLQTMSLRSSLQRKTFPSPCNARSLSMTTHRRLSQMAIPFFSLGCLAVIVGYYNIWSRFLTSRFQVAPMESSYCTRVHSIMPLLGCGWAIAGIFSRIGMPFPDRIPPGFPLVQDDGTKETTCHCQAY